MRILQKEKNKLRMAAACAVLSVLCITSCRQEETTSKPAIEKLEFKENVKEIKTGERVKIELTISPKEARTSDTVKYSVSTKDVVEIDETNSSNDGVVIKAVKTGNTVVTAKAGGVVEYCQIKVSGREDDSIPYIVLTDNVLEIRLGHKKHIVASLQGGTPGDYSNFMFSGGKDSIATVDWANNTAVIEGISQGSTRVTVSHPKAQYSVDVVVFVTLENETAQYITSSENVIFMEPGQYDRNYSVSVIGSTPEKEHYCMYQVVEGVGVITVKGTGASCTIAAVKEGIAKIRVSNQMVEQYFEFIVIVRKTDDVSYVSTDSSLYFIGAQQVGLQAYLNGIFIEGFEDNFTYTISDTNIIEVTQYKNTFFVKGLTNGTAKLTIHHKNSDCPAEVLFIVQTNAAAEQQNDFYIRTSQQVIQMEAGGPDAILTMELVNGTTADKSNFEWTVEDSSIITAVAVGIVHHRSQIQYEPMTVEAVITAKKTGTSRIRVYNHKAANEVNVLVKVYPKGTFYGDTISLSGPGITKVKVGEELVIYTPVVGGKAANIGVTEWTSDKESVATVHGSGLTGLVIGLQPGVTTVRNGGNAVINEWKGMVVVYSEGQQDTIPYIYTDHLQYTIPVGTIVKIPVYYPNLHDQDIRFEANNTHPEIVYHVMSDSVILASGIKLGRSEILISTNIPGCNDLTLTIDVVDDKIDISHPYSLDGPNFIGMKQNDEAQYTVNLIGAGIQEHNRLLFSVDDPSIVSVVRSAGNTVVLRGQKKGQTVLRINHMSSVNEKTVVAYVVDSDTEPNTVIFIGIEKSNYVLHPQDTVFIKLITNATSEQIKDFRWTDSDDDLLALDENYDKAVVMAKKTGNAKLTVTDSKKRHLQDLDIYFTITSAVTVDKTLGFPDVITIVKDQNKVVKGNAVNTTSSDINNISYTFEDPGIMALTGHGLELTIKGLAPGRTFLTVQCPAIGYYKKILAICAVTEEELAELYYFTLENPLYRIKKGEKIQIPLKFGYNGFPENEIPFIQWKNTVSGNAVTITSSYSVKEAYATVVGKNEGIAVIEITSRITGIPLQCTVEVVDNAKGSDYYWFMYNPMHQLKVNQIKNEPIAIYYGDYYYADEEGELTHGKELEHGYGSVEVSIEDPTVVKANLIGKILRIDPLKEGKTVITLSHEMIREDARILVAVYKDKIPSAAEELVIFAPKAHHLIAVNELKEITLYANTQDEDVLRSIKYENDKPEIADFYFTNHTLNAQAMGKKGGNTEIKIIYHGKTYENLFLSVSQYAQTNKLNVATESIIVLTLDDSNYATRVVITGRNDSPVVWTANNQEIIDVIGNGEFALLYPKRAGITELTVSSAEFERKIVVMVAPTEGERLNSSLINIDKRYFTLRKGEHINITPYYKMNKPVFTPKIESVSGNNVVQAEYKEGTIAVFGKNIGIEHLVIENPGCPNKIEITFEVSEQLQATVTETKQLTFMTADEPVIRLAKGHKNRIVSVKLIGEYAGGEKDFTWVSDNRNVTVTPMGALALISVGNSAGSYVLTVQNKNYCANDVEILILVGNEEYYENTTEPYLYTPRTTYTMEFGTSGLAIPIEVRNAGLVQWESLLYSSEKNLTKLRLTGGNLLIEARSVGVDIIHVQYPKMHDLVIYIIISDKTNNEAVYLTTSQNYVILGQGAMQVVEVSLENYEEPNMSKIKWESGDTNIAHIIGSGNTVQIIGMSLGTATITARHEKSLNDLDIVVKVVKPGASTQVCYLTTKDNVIETYEGVSGGQITVLKVGGKYDQMEATWTVDNPTVANVVGANGTAYYTVKKAGIMKVTVSDIEAGTLSIVIIVRAVKPGSQYLYTDSPIVQITPGTTNNVIEARLFGETPTDEKDFKWIIYSQLPSNPDVAKAGGTVIQLYEMGRRASVSAVNSGVARVKVTHPKAAEPLYIAVQVTKYSSLRFDQEEIEIVEGEMSFVTLLTPDYENFTEKVKFATAGAGVCTVMGSSRAALLSAQKPGTTEIDAYIEGTDLRAVIKVTVVPEHQFDQPEILTKSTMYILTPHDEPFTLDAQIMGVGISPSDQELLEWRIKGLEDRESSPTVRIWPQIEEYETINGQRLYRPMSRGRYVQIEVMNREYRTMEDCTIEITCPSLTKNKKTIYIMVREDSNAFKLTKTQITIEANDKAELACELMGGKTSDYDEVIWVCERDSLDPTKKIIDIVGNGKNVHIIGRADGVSKVTAIYRNLTATCKVTVKSSLYFNITFQNFQVFPGQRLHLPDEPDDGNFPFFEYEVRPVTAIIDWYNEDDFNLDHRAQIYIDPPTDVNGTGKGRIYIDALKEGTFYLMGTASQHASKVRIVIKNSFMFTLNRYNFYNTPYNYDYDQNKEFKTDRELCHTVGYTINPYSSRIAVKSGKISSGPLITSDSGSAGKTAQRKLMEEGLEIVIKPPHAIDNMRANGNIVVKNMKEFSSASEVTFELLKPTGETTGIEKTLVVHSTYPLGSGRLVPVFEPIDIVYSAAEINDPSFDYRNTLPNYPKGEKFNFGKYLHLYSLKNPTPNSKTVHDVYDITLGDGEEFYILMDKVIKDAYGEITMINQTPIRGNEQEVAGLKSIGPKTGSAYTNGISAHLITLEDGNKALRISGGKDFIAYSNFGSDYELTSAIASDQPHSSGSIDWQVDAKVSQRIYRVDTNTPKVDPPVARYKYVDDSWFGNIWDKYWYFNALILTGNTYVINVDYAALRHEHSNLWWDEYWVGSLHNCEGWYIIPAGSYVPKDTRVVNGVRHPVNFQYLSQAALTNDSTFQYWKKGVHFLPKGAVQLFGKINRDNMSAYPFYGFQHHAAWKPDSAYDPTPPTPEYDEAYYDVYNWQNDALTQNQIKKVYVYKTVSGGDGQPLSQVFDHYNWTPEAVDSTIYYLIPATINGARTMIRTKTGAWRSFSSNTLTTKNDLELFTSTQDFDWGAKVLPEQNEWSIVPQNTFSGQYGFVTDMGEDWSALLPYTQSGTEQVLWQYKTPYGSNAYGGLPIKGQGGKIIFSNLGKSNGTDWLYNNVFLVNFISRYIIYKNDWVPLAQSPFVPGYAGAAGTVITNLQSASGRRKFYGQLPAVFGEDSPILKKYMATNETSGYVSASAVMADLKNNYSYVEIQPPKYNEIDGVRVSDDIAWMRPLSETNDFPYSLSVRNKSDKIALIDVFKERYFKHQPENPYDQYENPEAGMVNANITNNPDINFRYYPVPSFNYSKIVHNDTITITIYYDMAGGVTNNILQINVKYEVRQSPYHFAPVFDENVMLRNGKKWTDLSAETVGDNNTILDGAIAPAHDDFEKTIYQGYVLIDKTYRNP